ncbi:MAG: hypothetical protein PHV23_05180 [Candidatus Gracilibacteria bacterium]|nr:hypothetical protein [Candidatus Gracilibacteria bacterium]
MSINTTFKVIVGDYAERHFIKRFKKKYKNIWLTTYKAIDFTLSRINKFKNKSLVEEIHSCDIGNILKCEFKVAGTNDSPHGSGNRYIVFQNNEIEECKILLLYGKTDIQGDRETDWWEGEIKNNYKEIAKLFSGLQ